MDAEKTAQHPGDVEIVAEPSHAETLRHQSMTLNLLGNFSTSTSPHTAEQDKVRGPEPPLPANHEQIFAQLAADRDRLIMKKLRGEPLSREEASDLRYVEWQIDRLEARQLKSDFEELGTVKRQYAQLADLVQQVNAFVRRG